MTTKDKIYWILMTIGCALLAGNIIVNYIT